uniref:PML-RAR alpha-regulated adaptor molecule 1 n=1 Tax=Nannospalax galili TaxID=1026970 RepID=A0A8C6QCP3_NANGA
MGSHQDFRSLQAKFQASQSQSGELPRKPPKPEFNKNMKPPQPQLGEQPSKSLPPEVIAVSLKPLQLQVSDLSKKPLQPEFTDLKFTQPEVAGFPKKPPKPEFTDLPKKPSESEPTDLPRKSPKPQFARLPKKPPKPEFGELSKKSPQLEIPQKVLQQEPLKPNLSNPTRTPLELKPSALPKFLQPEYSEAPLGPSQFEFPKKPPQPQAGSFPRKSLTQAESSKFPQTTCSKSESSEPYPHTPKPDFCTRPTKSPQCEFNENLRKTQQTPPKSPQQPELYEVPQTPPWKSESCDPQPHSPQPGFSAFPKKHSQLQLSDLTRTSSEPEVCTVPKRPRQPEFKVFSKKPLQPELGHLPRTSSEPEFGLLPRKFLQPERQGKPQFKGLPRKPQLPGSVSESSLPTAITGSSPRFGATGRPRWRSEDFHVPHPPQRRPLPSVSSLGSPPVKPPLPPGPINIQSFRRASAGTTAVQRTGLSAGTHFQAQRPQHILQDSDEIYELYDDVELTDDSSPSPRGRDEVQSTQQVTRRLQQDSELRKEKATQAQQLPPTDPKLLKQIRKAEKAEREFRKKFKFEGEIVIHTRMMIDPNAKARRGGGKHLGIRRGEILEVIEFTSKDEMLCRDPKGKCKYGWPTPREGSVEYWG